MQDNGQANGLSKKKRIVMSVVASVFAVLAIALAIYVFYKSSHISTDDAFIEGRRYVVAPRVGGSVAGVYAEDNQMVSTGDLLIDIDTTDYEVAASSVMAELEKARLELEERQAKVDMVRHSLIERKSAVKAASASLVAREASERQALSDFQRAVALNRKGILSREKYEVALTARDVARAMAEEARQGVRQAETAVDTHKALLRQTEAAVATQRAVIALNQASVDAANLSLGYTNVTSPGNGYVTRKGVERGNRIKAGQPLMAIVDIESVWVIANYKETQIRKIQPGQRVVFAVDAWPGEKFTGHVDSIMAGSGSAFSLFPPENATGNYVKVVQRVPVKIIPDAGTFGDHVPRVGMSVVPTVLVE